MLKRLELIISVRKMRFTISEVTRPASGTLLDHFYTNVHNMAESGTIGVDISDHTAIYMVLKCTRNKIKEKAVIWQGLIEDMII